MAEREGLNFDEKVLGRFTANYQVLMSNQQGVQLEKFLNGDLILTESGVVFLESKGVLQKKRVRHHSYDYDIIKAVRTESRGITGALSGHEFIILEIESPSRPMTVKYSCTKNDCGKIRRSLEDRISFRLSSDSFQKELV
ncbi:MAG: hypothetical protein ACTSSE_16710 [Candidatus Thorarchaeota archaeon]